MANVYDVLKERGYLKQLTHEEEIKELLFIPKANDPRLSNAISTILAVLNIPTIELGSIPLAHYTSPIVCHKLFGIGEEINPLRIGSSTDMNDPSEGKTLLEFLDVQDLELENKVDYPTYNAFFTCFSSRVNDLNQFRLYGKEDGIAKIDAEEVKYCDVSQSVFSPYSDIRDIVDEVILGTNYEKTSRRRKAEVFQYQMRKLCPDVKVSRSSLPINPPLR